ncbi:MAG: hypothetical protein OEW15_05835 [Nitrospirota bacterium]|nr:hypothetical protein [Nitrospirota bacterium]
MKKILIVLFVIAAVTLSLSVYGLDLGVNVKKKSCEAACDKSYDECMKKAKEDNEKAKDEVKKKAGELGCAKSKDECYKKCK